MFQKIFIQSFDISGCALSPVQRASHRESFYISKNQCNAHGESAQHLQLHVSAGCRVQASGAEGHDYNRSTRHRLGPYRGHISKSPLLQMRCHRYCHTWWNASLKIVPILCQSFPDLSSISRVWTQKTAVRGVVRLIMLVITTLSSFFATAYTRSAGFTLTLPLSRLDLGLSHSGLPTLTLPTLVFPINDVLWLQAGEEERERICLGK